MANIETEMETVHIVYVLHLNDMRSPKIEILAPVAWAASENELQQFVESERVEYYRDGQWGKSFRRGGPLEWCNPGWRRERNIVRTRVSRLENLSRIPRVG